MEKKNRILKVLGKLLGAVLTLAALAGLYLTLVIAQPQEEPAEKQAQPLLAAAPGMKISAEGELRELIRGFPAPVMSFMSGSGMVFVSGEAEGFPLRGQYGRRITLYWQTREGEPMILQSVYPADALETLGGGNYHFSGSAGPALFGRSSVRMENGTDIRIHVQEEGQGLYVLTLPRGLEAALSGIARSIQLFSAE